MHQLDLEVTRYSYVSVGLAWHRISSLKASWLHFSFVNWGCIESCSQCFLFSRIIGQVTPKIYYFHNLYKYFLDQSIPKNISFYFEKGSTACSSVWAEAVLAWPLKFVYLNVMHSTCKLAAAVTTPHQLCRMKLHSTCKLHSVAHERYPQ